jgi:hypothetical protein
MSGYKHTKLWCLFSQSYLYKLLFIFNGENKNKYINLLLSEFFWAFILDVLVLTFVDCYYSLGCLKSQMFTFHFISMEWIISPCVAKSLSQCWSNFVFHNLLSKLAIAHLKVDKKHQKLVAKGSQLIEVHHIRHHGQWKSIFKFHRWTVKITFSASKLTLYLQVPIQISTSDRVVCLDSSWKWHKMSEKSRSWSRDGLNLWRCVFVCFDILTSL